MYESKDFKRIVGPVRQPRGGVNWFFANLNRLQAINWFIKT